MEKENNTQVTSQGAELGTEEVQDIEEGAKELDPSKEESKS